MSRAAGPECQCSHPYLRARRRVNRNLPSAPLRRGERNEAWAYMDERVGKAHAGEARPPFGPAAARFTAPDPRGRATTGLIRLFPTPRPNRRAAHPRILPQRKRRNPAYFDAAGRITTTGVDGLIARGVAGALRKLHDAMGAGFRVLATFDADELLDSLHDVTPASQPLRVVQPAWCCTIRLRNYFQLRRGSS
jgi:hypothetical protein